MQEPTAPGTPDHMLAERIARTLVEEGVIESADAADLLPLLAGGRVDAAHWRRVAERAVDRAAASSPSGDRRG